MTKECTTHHHACDCREAKLREMERELAELKQTARRLVTDTHDKWAIDRLIILAGEQ